MPWNPLPRDSSVAATTDSVILLKHALPAARLAIRPSACPGLLRIVEALDGGICRVKLPCGRLGAAQALIVAAAAERHGSGVIEVTNRANLQLRGIRGNAQEALIAELLDAGLGPTTPAADDVRNLMVSPAAGFDTQASVAIPALADRLLATLQNTPRFHALSAKFAVQLDGGERLAMLRHPHDIWLSAMDAGPEPLFAFGLAGCPPQAAGDALALAAVPMARVLQLFEALLQLFLDLASPEQTRMRHLLQSCPPSELLQRLQARLDFPLLPAAGWRRATPPEWAHLGIQQQRQPGRVMVGVAVPLGRLEASQLTALAALSQRFGDASLRLTPWQGLLLPNVAEDEAAELLARLQALGLIGDADQPLARLIACTGSQGCVKGKADTKGDALRLAARLRNAVSLPGLHLSGCERSCAAAHTAPLTLLAVADGRYHLFAHDVCTPGFGRVLARNLTLSEAGDLLASAPGPWSSTR